MATPDFTCRFAGSVWAFRPCTDEARTFVRENVEIPSWAWLGDCFHADHRHAAALADAITAEGFFIEMEG